jgi:hypothetical protein
MSIPQLHYAAEAHGQPARAASYCVVNDLAGLMRIQRPQWNFLLWRRSVAAGVGEWLRAAGPQEAHETRRILHIKSLAADVDALLATFAASAAPKASMHTLVLQAAADVSMLAQQFAQVGDTKTLKACLAVVTTNKCKKFHADFKPLRLLCTYAGAGTEWVDDADVDRSMFGQDFGSIDAANARIVPDYTNVQRAKTGEVIIMKGEMFLGNRGRGAVHRSPTLQEHGGYRIVLTLDAE